MGHSAKILDPLQILHVRGLSLVSTRVECEASPSFLLGWDFKILCRKDG